MALNKNPSNYFVEIKNTNTTHYVVTTFNGNSYTNINFSIDVTDLYSIFRRKNITLRLKPFKGFDNEAVQKFTDPNGNELIFYCDQNDNASTGNINISMIKTGMYTLEVINPYDKKGIPINDRKLIIIEKLKQFKYETIDFQIRYCEQFFDTKTAESTYTTTLVAALKDA